MAAVCTVSLGGTWLLAGAEGPTGFAVGDLLIVLGAFVWAVEIAR